MIKTIVFDIGNVLIGFDWDRYVRRLFDEETAQRVTRAMFGGSHWKELDRAVLSEDEIFELFCSEEPEYRKQIREACDRIGECIEKLDWPVPLIESLRARGYQLLYLSNMSEFAMTANPPAFGFAEHMDGGIYSCDVHLIKPDPAFFKLLFERYDLTPEECLFIDDQRDNIETAKKLGMKTIRFLSHEQLMADLGTALRKDAGHDRISVLCYGDSNTYGYDPSNGSRCPYEKRWTTILADMLGDRYEVIPEGLNGRTTAYDRPGAAWKNGLSSFAACIGTHKPVDFIVIMLGTNDSIEEMGLGAEQIAAGMESLVETVEEIAPGLQGYVPQIIVTAPAAMQGDFEKSPFAHDISPEAIEKTYAIEPLYRDIAKRHECLFASAVSGIDVSADCMHLSEEGHRQLADMLYGIITQKV